MKKEKKKFVKCWKCGKKTSKMVCACGAVNSSGK